MGGVAAGAADARSADANVIEGQYIVVYGDGVEVGAATDAREQELGFTSDHRYRAAVDGFAAKLSDAQVDALESDPAVAFVQQDRYVQASDWVPRVAGEPRPPTGIRRIVAAKGTDVREAAQPSVAVIDTGVNLSHPDLRVQDGKDCVDLGTTAEDGNGHGTHVSGTIGAQNDGAGVVGVAPNTRIQAVRVLNNSGSGTFAQIVCGVDWVTANTAARNIQVANMSLGGLLGTAQSACPGTSDALHLAICNSTGAGVTYVVAAGNDNWDFDFAANPNVPAAYKEVLTVTAASDSDGKPGALGPVPPASCSAGPQVDEAEANFSNFAATAAGELHTIAAPGVCIKSTWLAGGYNTISGTSMASPHMAGLAALCHREVGSGVGPCQTRTPAQNIVYLRTRAAGVNNADPNYGYLHDPISSPIAGQYFGFLTKTPNPLP